MYWIRFVKFYFILLLVFFFVVVAYALYCVFTQTGIDRAAQWLTGCVLPPFHLFSGVKR